MFLESGVVMAVVCPPGDASNPAVKAIPNAISANIGRNISIDLL